MKLPMPSANEINNLAIRAEDAIYRSNSRGADVQIIENAIRNALAIVVSRLDIEVGQLTLNLRKD